MAETRSASFTSKFKADLRVRDLICLSAHKFNLMYRAFSHDITTAMLVSETKPLGIELYLYANTFFCFSKPIWPVVT